MKQHYFTYTTPKENIHTQLADCMNAYSEFCKHFQQPLALRCTFFISAPDNSAYQQIKDYIIHNTKSVFHHAAVVGEPPYRAAMAMECVVIDRHELDADIHFRYVEDIPYLVLEQRGNKVVYAAGICGSLDLSIKEQSDTVFSLVEAILLKENMNFSHVFRQWNYIENITKFVYAHDTDHQHYQIFNDIRSLYYKKVHFQNGYPSATGIGMDTGGIILEIIAGKGSDFDIIPIDNPAQINAHQYSENVLVGKKNKESSKKTTPKFERAKYVRSPLEETLYISGTAAIRGENTVPSDSIVEQTNITLDNIHKLRYKRSEDLPYSHYRIYVKDLDSVPQILYHVRRFFGDIPSLVVKAPVCRENLLVEIEADKEY